jgi:uncharacterized membrane protein
MVSLPINQIFHSFIGILWVMSVIAAARVESLEIRSEGLHGAFSP